MRELASKFPKPSWYAGLEDGAIIKDKDKISLRAALVFPDTYEVGMSYLGQKILYDIINSRPEWHAERALCPEWEAARILSENNVPLATLETDTDLKDLDAVCFSITHELCFTDVLHMLDLARIPLRSSERSQDLSQSPVIMAGGGAMMGAEALTPFVDLVSLGDGEEQLPEIFEVLEKAKRSGLTRDAFLEEVSRIPGVYIPSFFTHDQAGRIRALRDGCRPARRIVSNLDDAPYPIRQVTPVSAVHNRLSLEIARGCSRGCRYCHAGIVYRPPRERSLDNLGKILDQCLDATGYDEVSFLALSAGDYSALNALYNQSYDRCAAEQISLALPSLRVSSVGGEVLNKMASLRHTGMTLAPEAGTQRMRDVINKGITEEDLLRQVQLLAELGWRHMKLYFMIGLPTETDEDLRGIYDLCQKAQSAGSIPGRKMQITASISTFTPKPFTPFQWEAQISLEEMERRIGLLRGLFKNARGMKLRWHDPKASRLEGILSRSDRRLADVVERAYKKGAVYCGWREFFNLDLWLEAMAECGLSPDEYTGERSLIRPLPWDHLECGVSSEFLRRERDKAYAAAATPDCRYGVCSNCGVCDKPGRPSPLAKSRGGSSQCRLVFSVRDQLEEPAAAAIPNVQAVKNSENSLRVHYRLWHRKMGNFSLLSQLELQSVMEKIMRRAKLPLAFSQGFHPLPRISFGRALPVGMESRAEWAAFTLVENIPPIELMEKFNKLVRAELSIFSIDYVNKDLRSEQAEKEIFNLSLDKPESLQDAFAAFAAFSEKKSFSHERRTKTGVKNLDIRPLLESWEKKGPSIQFTASWLSGYLSPLALARAILNSREDREIGFRLRKEAQIFSGGRAFGAE